MGRKPVYDNTVRLHINMSANSKERLQILSKRSGKNVSKLINEGIDTVIQTYEDEGVYSDLRSKEDFIKERTAMLQADGKNHEAKVIAFTNHKGGVAKTTTCTALAVLLGKQGKRVLVVDIDTQKNSSDLMGYEIGGDEPTVADYFATYFNKGRERDITKYLLPTRYDNVDVVTSSQQMQMSFEQTVRDTSADRGDLVGHLFREIKALNIYDYILVDTPPSIGILVTSTYKEADWLVIPTEADKYGVEGAVEVFSFVDQREADGLPVAKIAGVVFARTVTNTAMAKSIPEIKAQLTEAGIRSFNTFIPQCSDVPKSRAEGRPVTDKYPSCKAAKKYEEMLKELEVIVNGI